MLRIDGQGGDYKIMVFNYHALFEFIGIIATGYVIARLLLKLPMIKEFLKYDSKKGVNRANNPNPINNADDLEISENVISYPNPVKDFSEGQNYPLCNDTINMSSSPLTQKTDNLAHLKSIIKRLTTKCK